MTIVPAILEQRFRAIESKFARVSGLVDTVQVDICDGQFVPSKTYAMRAQPISMKRLGDLAQTHKTNLEIDMMVHLDCGNCMERWVEALLATKPTRVIFHLGSTYRWDELFTHLEQATRGRGLPFECGLAVRIDSTRREIAKTYDEHPFSFIQIMGIKRVGYSGQQLSPDIYDRIKKIRRMYNDIDISIDGGVKEKHIDDLLNAGATRLGMNSGLFKSKHFDKLVGK